MDKTIQDEKAEDRRLHERARAYVATDAEFVSHVQRGIESAKAEPTRDFEAIDAEIRRSLLAP